MVSASNAKTRVAVDAVKSAIPAERRKYASALMFDRKRRILTEAQALLDEHGVDGFTIRELSRRADVAQRTLYNVFGSKEDIIASAIELHFNTLIERTRPLAADADLDTLVQRSQLIVDVIVRLRRYATAMVGAYFAPGSDPKIHDSLVRIWRSDGAAWLRPSLLVKMSPARLDALAGLLVNAAYANIGDWLTGRISEAEFRRRTSINSLTICRSYLKPSIRARADELIAAAFGE